MGLSRGGGLPQAFGNVGSLTGYQTPQAWPLLQNGGSYGSAATMAQVRTWLWRSLALTWQTHSLLECALSHVTFSSMPH